MMVTNMQQQQKMMATMMEAMAQNMGVPQPMQPGLTAPANNVSNLFERFQRYRPPMLVGTHRPEEAEYWLNRVTKLLKRLHCTETESVELLSYLFEKEADLWWESVLRSILEGHQGSMTVAQYENRFTELSHYASEMIASEAIKMRRFLAGLRSGIRSKMCCVSIRTYAELVEMATQAEQDEERVARVRSQLGPRNRVEGPSSSFTGKRARPSLPPRQAAAPAPSARPA
ncbi:uncharacterized protein LOC131254347 [Magnolia sinica]|uniref:uncharacterized protein LOC131254347 n=1 Tax=Magnolia sinica TaxID=86752 RepID=UPI00265B4477|nr:uncharacterized protein LOC131254347 [Magnolia sinica]